MSAEIPNAKVDLLQSRYREAEDGRFTRLPQGSPCSWCQSIGLIDVADRLSPGYRADYIFKKVLRFEKTQGKTSGDASEKNVSHQFVKYQLGEMKKQTNPTILQQFIERVMQFVTGKLKIERILDDSELKLSPEVKKFLKNFKSEPGVISQLLTLFDGTQLESFVKLQSLGGSFDVEECKEMISKMGVLTDSQKKVVLDFILISRKFCN